MQMAGICVCITYADVQHMDMHHIYVLLSFSVQIRKPVEAEKVRLPFVHCQQLVLHTWCQIRRLGRHINPFIYDRMFLD